MGWLCRYKLRIIVLVVLMNLQPMGALSAEETIAETGAPTGPVGHAAKQEVSANLRMPVDTVGYATRPGQIEAVIALSDSMEAGLYSSNVRSYPCMLGGGMIGAVAPHDDYLYAGPVYVHVMREIKVPLVILFGVSHTARRRNIQDKLIFDSFEAWKGPYGPCRVSPLREAVAEALPGELVLVSNEIQAEEHSLEAFIPFLQYYNREVQILPILVSRLRGPLFENAADTLAAVLYNETGKLDLEIGRDFVILISADCVHYGDDGWGGRNYAPFGVDCKGYEKAVSQDLEIIDLSLTGALNVERISIFREKVERDDFQWPYKITWCGVYSIPFGLSVLSRLSGLLDMDPPEGYLLRYATSRDPGKLPLDDTGFGVTNISTRRHWVGYAAIGYW